MIMMFSSTNNIIGNPLLSSSSYHPLPPTVSSHETSNSYLHHYHCDPLLGPFLSTSPQLTESLINMALTNNATMVEQNNTERLNGEHYAFSSLIPCKRVVKKDRHSKIHTAQGLRDRRVRLSIEIARRFFDLQDMLGFDKASKTLEWLLNKSSKAIKELAQMKGSFHGGAKNLSGTSECEVESEDGDLECILSSSKPMVRTASGEKKMRRLHKAAIMHQAKESRAKARERARERTKEKMCTRKLRDWKKGSETNPGISNPSRSLNPSEAAEKSTDAYGHNITSSFRGVTDHDVEEPRSRPLSREDLIEESILIRRKLKTSSILGYQQKIVMSKDVSCSSSSHNNNNNYFLNLPQNWEINGAIAHSTFCAITNMNRSSGLQIYSKPCESHDNQCPL